MGLDILGYRTAAQASVSCLNQSVDISKYDYWLHFFDEYDWTAGLTSPETASVVVERKSFVVARTDHEFCDMCG